MTSHEVVTRSKALSWVTRDAVVYGTLCCRRSIEATTIWIVDARVYTNRRDAIAIAAKITHDGLSTTAPDVDPEPDADVAALPIVEEAVVALAAPTAGV
jgi:hypothetical protein